MDNHRRRSPLDNQLRRTVRSERFAIGLSGAQHVDSVTPHQRILRVLDAGLVQRRQSIAAHDLDVQIDNAGQ